MSLKKHSMDGWYMNTPQGPTGPLTEQQLRGESV
jgi:hypothetical protein